MVGELPVEIDRGVLRRGALSAIGGVTCLYVLVTIAYVSINTPRAVQISLILIDCCQSIACPFGDLVDNDVGVAIKFVPKVGICMLPVLQSNN